MVEDKSYFYAVSGSFQFGSDSIANKKPLGRPGGSVFALTLNYSFKRASPDLGYGSNTDNSTFLSASRS